MGRGIEHREPESLIKAYEDYGKCNFAIFSGRDLVLKYDEGDPDEGMAMLQGCVNMIMNSDTRAVYMLKVYNDKVGAVNTKTPSEGSTTFMLSKSAITTTDGNGKMIIDRTAMYTGGNGKTDPAMLGRLDRLEQENKELLERVHRSELDNLRQQLTETFDKRISGLEQKEATNWEKVESFVDRFWDRIERTAKDIYFEFKPKNNYIQDKQPAAAMSGTANNKNKENSETMEASEVVLTPEGALVNPFLTDEQRKLKKSEQANIVKEMLTPLPQDSHDDLQTECLEIIEKRIGAVTLSRMLLAVACLDNDDLNKLLNNLD